MVWEGILKWIQKLSLQSSFKSEVYKYPLKDKNFKLTINFEGTNHSKSVLEWWQLGLE